MGCRVTDGKNLGKRGGSDGGRTRGDFSFWRNRLGKNEWEGFVAGGSVSGKNAQSGGSCSSGRISNFAGEVEESG